MIVCFVNIKCQNMLPTDCKAKMGKKTKMKFFTMPVEKRKKIEMVPNCSVLQFECVQLLSIWGSTC